MTITEFCIIARVAIWERQTYAPNFGFRFALIREDGDEMTAIATRPTGGALMAVLNKAAHNFTASSGVSKNDARAALKSALEQDEARREARRGVVTPAEPGPHDGIVQRRRRPEGK